MRFLSLSLFLVLALGLSACGKSSENPNGSLLDSLTKTPDETFMEDATPLETPPVNEYKYNPTSLPPALNP